MSVSTSDLNSIVSPMMANADYVITLAQDAHSVN